MKNKSEIIAKRRGTSSKIRRYSFMIETIRRERNISEPALREMIVQAEREEMMGQIDKRTVVNVLKTLERVGLVHLEPHFEKIFIWWTTSRDRTALEE